MGYAGISSSGRSLERKEKAWMDMPVGDIQTFCLEGPNVLL